MGRIVTTSPKWLGTTFVAGCFYAIDSGQLPLNSEHTATKI